VRESIVNPEADDIEGDGRYRLTFISSDGSGTILPTIGIMIEF
jgi:hypothetical protein